MNEKKELSNFNKEFGVSSNRKSGWWGRKFLTTGN